MQAALFIGVILLMLAAGASLGLAWVASIRSGVSYGMTDEFNPHDQLAWAFATLAVLLSVIAGVILGATL